MMLAHKIALDPSNKQRTYFGWACGVARFSYNWALAEWKRQYKAGGKPSQAALRRQLNGNITLDVRRDEVRSAGGDYRLRHGVPEPF